MEICAALTPFELLEQSKTKIPEVWVRLRLMLGALWKIKKQNQSQTTNHPASNRVLSSEDSPKLPPIQLMSAINHKWTQGFVMSWNHQVPSTFSLNRLGAPFRSKRLKLQDCCQITSDLTEQVSVDITCCFDSKFWHHCRSDKEQIYY